MKNIFLIGDNFFDDVELELILDVQMFLFEPEFIELMNFQNNEIPRTSEIRTSNIICTSSR